MKQNIFYAFTILIIFAMTQVFATTKRTLCLTEPATLHSVSNKVQASTEKKENWILGGVNNTQTKTANYPLQIKSACYKLTKLNTKKIILRDREITSKFFKIELDNNQSLQAEKREVRKLNKKRIL